MPTFKQLMKLAQVTVNDKTSGKRAKEILEIVHTDQAPPGMDPQTAVRLDVYKRQQFHGELHRDLLSKAQQRAATSSGKADAWLRQAEDRFIGSNCQIACSNDLDAAT